MRILSISPWHDASVCVLSEAGLECYFKEERLSRTKHDSYPYFAIARACEEAQGKITDIITAAPCEDPIEAPMAKYAQKLLGAGDSYCSYSHRHHLQHAWLAYHNSGFSHCAVIVVDRIGSSHPRSHSKSETESVYEFRSLSQHRPIIKRYRDHAVKISHSDRYSITRVYEAAGEAIGVGVLESGKVMGLSAYGRSDRVTQPLFLENNTVNAALFAETESEICRFRNRTRTEHVGPEDYHYHADLALSVQLATQQQLAALVSEAHKQTGAQQFCITGGYALNIVANSFLLEQFPQFEFWFEPMADDTGNSIGAALGHYAAVTGKVPEPILNNGLFFHGVKHHAPTEADCSVDAAQIAAYLQTNKSVGVYEGLSEAGQRALGHRSILHSAFDPQAKAVVNRIKNREWYRPFACAVLEEDITSIAHSVNSKHTAYMTNSFRIKQAAADRLSGVVHADGTARLQSVKRDSTLGRILAEIKKQTGLGVVLNTSMNLAGEPLVETPQQAIDLYSSSSLGLLWFADTGAAFRKAGDSNCV